MNVLILCPRRYNGHQLYTVIDVLDRRGHVFDIASSDWVIQDEETDEPFRVTDTFAEMRVDSIGYAGIIITSGNLEEVEIYLWNYNRMLDLVYEFDKLDKPIAAIAETVPVVRFAANNKQVSYFPLVHARDLLETTGAILNKVTVTRDDNLVTGEHTGSARKVTEEFCKILEGEPRETVTFDSEFKTLGRKPRAQDLVAKVKRLREEREAREAQDGNGPKVESSTGPGNQEQG